MRLESETSSLLALFESSSVFEKKESQSFSISRKEQTF